MVLVFGTCGAMRTSELVNLETQHVEDNNTIFIVTIDENKNDYPRTFIIGKEYYDIVNKYIKLRPTDCPHTRFFVNYQRGKCTKQVIGKNKFSDMPKIIANFLQLENSEKFTGHCFRRTAATLLANSGANVTSIKQLGGWRSSTVAEGYVENSLTNRKNIYEGIMNPVYLTTSTSKSANQPQVQTIDVDDNSPLLVQPSNADDHIIPETPDDEEFSNLCPESVENNKSISEESKIQPQLKLSEQVNSLKRPALKNRTNINENKAKKRLIEDIPMIHQDEVEIENKIIESVTINSRFVNFTNCEIKQIIINNYGKNSNQANS